MSNLMMSGGGQFVDRNTVALVETPERTDSWKPVPHIAVIDAVTEVVNAPHAPVRIVLRLWSSYGH